MGVTYSEHEWTDVDAAVGIDDGVLHKMSEAIPGFASVIKGAHAATDFEHQMTVREALRLYPKGIAFSVILSFAIVMEGYDVALLGSFYGFPAFNKRFGFQLSDGTYQISSPWQSGLQNGAMVGEVLGLMLAGVLADRFGYRKTLLGALIMVTGTIFILFFAQNIKMLLAGEILCGIPWGAFQTLTTTYAAEVSPIVLRPYLTTFVNFCWVIGQLISAGVLRSLLHRTDDWAWRIPYAIQWIWPVPIIIGVALAPESPWWLVRKGRADEAKKALRSLTSKEMDSSSVDDTIDMMVHTNELEKFVSSGVSYSDCFTGVDLRRTEITCCVWIIQVLCGAPFAGAIVYFLEQVGLSVQTAFDFGIILSSIALLANICSWFVIPYVGRRILYLCGLGVMFSILLSVGLLGIPSHPPGALAWISACLLLLFVLTYNSTVGPVCYCLVAEIPSTRLRIKSVVLARNFYNITYIGANFLNPPILNPTAWNLKGKGGFIWSGFCLVSFVWTFFRLPEPKDLTSAELDVKFEQKISARNFSKVKADPFLSLHSNITGDEETNVPEKSHLVRSM